LFLCALLPLFAGAIPATIGLTEPPLSDIAFPSIQSDSAQAAIVTQQGNKDEKPVYESPTTALVVLP